MDICKLLFLPLLLHSDISKAAASAGSQSFPPSLVHKWTAGLHRPMVHASDPVPASSCIHVFSHHSCFFLFLVQSHSNVKVLVSQHIAGGVSKPFVSFVMFLLLLTSVSLSELHQTSISSVCSPFTIQDSSL